MKSLFETLEKRALYSFTLAYNSTTGAYTATDNDDVASDGGSRFFLSVSAGKYMLTQKDNNGNVVGTSVNLGANGAAGLTVNLGAGRDYWVTDSTVSSATTPNGTAIVLNINGGSGNDVITGGLERDSVRGGDGDDNIAVGIGNDTVRGENGNDVIDGGANSDYLYGDAGNDTIFGGGGNDQIYSGSGSDDLYDYYAGTSDIDYDYFHYNSTSFVSFGPGDAGVNDQPL